MDQLECKLMQNSLQMHYLWIVSQCGFLPCNSNTGQWSSHGFFLLSLTFQIYLVQLI